MSSLNQAVLLTLSVVRSNEMHNGNKAMVSCMVINPSIHSKNALPSTVTEHVSYEGGHGTYMHNEAD